MEKEIKFREIAPLDCSRSMVIVSFPSPGLVGSLAASYMVRSLKLGRVGTFSSDDFVPTAVIYDGVPSPPVRVFGGKRECAPDELCNEILVIMSELPVPLGMIKSMSDVILNWCGDKNANMIVTLEGANTPLLPDQEPKVYAVGTTDKAREMISKHKIEPLTEGMVGGISGVLLYEGEEKEKDVLCLMAEANIELPGAMGAAKLVEIISRMLPELKIDPKPLFEEAKQLEDQIKNALKAASPLPPEDREVPPGLYG
ncbi:MAG: proteasome assembly chaperone family protein [Thermoplasmata archaeon]|nr:MAG: proteasome assembly chaperone family protein [Thermoplasmata archaeon]